VLVAGGDGDSARPAELYDPRSGTWTPTGIMIEAHEWPTATLLRDGTVLVTGGERGANDVVASVELYDPRSGTWTATANMDVARRMHTATLLPDGSVLVVGGVGDDRASGSAELYGSGGGH
jgi:hypothetical protein